MIRFYFTSETDWLQSLRCGRHLTLKLPRWCIKLHVRSVVQLPYYSLAVIRKNRSEKQKWNSAWSKFKNKDSHRCRTARPDPSPSGRGASWTAEQSRPRRNRRATGCSTRTHTPRRPGRGTGTARSICRSTRWTSSWTDLKAKPIKKEQKIIRRTSKNGGYNHWHHFSPALKEHYVDLAKKYISLLTFIDLWYCCTLIIFGGPCHLWIMQLICKTV